MNFNNISCKEIILNKTSLTFKNKTPQLLSVKVLPANTTDIIIYRSSDDNIATVKNGIIYPNKNGNCVIRIFCGNKIAYCSIIVNIKDDINVMSKEVSILGTSSATSPLITIVAEAGSSLTDNGKLDVPITVDGLNFIKTFSWSKIYKGEAGADADLENIPDWITEWDNQKTTINGMSVLSPRIFAGTVTDGVPTGVAIGKNVFGEFGTYGNISGIAGYKDGTKTYHLNNSGDLLIGKKDGSHISWDGNDLEIVIGSSAVATESSVSSAIQQKADSITATVSQNYLTKTDASNQYATQTQMSQVTQTASKISWLVRGNSMSEMSLTNEAINLISSSIKIEAPEINLHGYVTANGNFKIDLNGNMTANNAKIQGNLTSCTIDAGTINGTTINGGSIYGAYIKSSASGGYTELNNGFIYTTHHIVMSCNSPGLRGEYSNGSIATICHVSRNDEMIFGYGSYASQSSTAYTNGVELRGGRTAIVKSKGNVWICCNDGIENSTGGQSIIYVLNSASRYTFRSNGNGNTDLGYSNTPWRTCYANTHSNTSDRTLKENIHYLSNSNISNKKASVLSKNNIISLDECYDFITNRLSLATYNYITDDEKLPKIGFIAQDILCDEYGNDDEIGQMILGRLSNSEEGEKLCYDMNNVIGVMMGAMQVMASKIEELESKQ